MGWDFVVPVTILIAQSVISSLNLFKDFSKFKSLGKRVYGLCIVAVLIFGIWTQQKSRVSAQKKDGVISDLNKQISDLNIQLIEQRQALRDGREENERDHHRAQ